MGVGAGRPGPGRDPAGRGWRHRLLRRRGPPHPRDAAARVPRARPRVGRARTPLGRVRRPARHRGRRRRTRAAVHARGARPVRRRLSGALPRGAGVDPGRPSRRRVGTAVRGVVAERRLDRAVDRARPRRHPRLALATRRQRRPDRVHRRAAIVGAVVAERRPVARRRRSVPRRERTPLAAPLHAHHGVPSDHRRRRGGHRPGMVGHRRDGVRANRTPPALDRRPGRGRRAPAHCGGRRRGRTTMAPRRTPSRVRAWLPDAHHLVFVRDRTVWLVDANGGDASPIGGPLGPGAAEEHLYSVAP